MQSHRLSARSSSSSEISTDLACNQTSCNEFILRNGFCSFWDPDLIVLLDAHGASFPVLCNCSLSDCMTPVWSWVKALANCATSASFISECILCKGIVHPQTKSLSSCIHQHDVANLTMFFGPCWFSLYKKTHNFSKCLPLCSAEQGNSYRFRTEYRFCSTIK